MTAMKSVQMSRAARQFCWTKRPGDVSSISGQYRLTNPTSGRSLICYSRCCIPTVQDALLSVFLFTGSLCGAHMVRWGGSEPADTPQKIGTECYKTCICVSTSGFLLLMWKTDWFVGSLTEHRAVPHVPLVPRLCLSPGWLTELGVPGHRRTPANLQPSVYLRSPWNQFSVFFIYIRIDQYFVLLWHRPQFVIEINA